MARSYKKTPIFGNTTGSDTKARRGNNRRYRRIAKVAVMLGKEVPKRREVTNVWDWPGDGRGYWADAPVEAMRK